jgi:L-threonylcarbamoyladenylate synthase
MLMKVLPRVEQASDAEQASDTPRSPGMKYRHYAPQAEMLVVVGDPERVREKILAMADEARNQGKKVGILAAEEEQDSYPGFLVAAAGSSQHPEITAQRLYALLRWLDTQQVDLILTEGVAPEGLGSAIMNRLSKAAGYNIIQV